MNKNEKTAFEYFMPQWKHQWDLNRYYRDWYNEDLEYYRGYRNSLNYPYTYNISFNKLLPRVMTVMSRFMDQLYQAGTGNLVSVKPRKRSDVERAPRIEGLLNYQLECLNDVDTYGGSYLTNFQWMFNALTFGKGIVKLYWHKEERIAPTRFDIPIPTMSNGQLGMDTVGMVVDHPQIIYDGPYAEVVHNKLFNPHPHYRNIQKMPMVGCLYRKSIDYCKRQEQKGIFKNVKDLAWTNTGSGKTGSTAYGEDSSEAFSKSLEIEGATEWEIENIHNERRTPEIDIIEAHGRYIWPEDETAYEVGSGYKIKGAETETIIHIGNYKTTLRLEKNTMGVRPFFDIGCYYHPELFWDIGIVRLGQKLQEQYDNMANLRSENAMMQVNQMFKVRESADIDPASMVWRPYGIVPVEDMEDIQPMPTGDMFQSGAFREQEQFFEDVIADITGVYPYNMGQEPQRQERVGVVQSLQSMGEARTKLLMMTMDHTGFRPFLKYMMQLNVLNLPTDFETRIANKNGVDFSPLFSGDLHPDYDFSARYTAMEPALGKMYKSQQLAQYAAMWKDSPYMQHYQFQKAVLEMLDFQNSDVLLKAPEQLAKEQQQQAMAAVQKEMMGFQMQSQLQKEKQQGEMETAVVKEIVKQQGEVVGQAQKIRGELANTVIKEMISDTKEGADAV